MIVFDDRSEGVLMCEHHLVLTEVIASEDVVFKASFIILGDLRCSGKVTALFDLKVLGDIDAEEIDVKGGFLCIGKCMIKTSLTVQNDIWANQIEVAHITCHERIIVQSADVTSIHAEGVISVAKTMAVEEEASSNQSIICGETAYGAGKLVAKTVITAEPLDMDDGIDALESPNNYVPEGSPQIGVAIIDEASELAELNDYNAYIDRLLTKLDEHEQQRLKEYQSVLSLIDSAYPDSVKEITDAALLLKLIEISHSTYFSCWTTIGQWTDTLKNHFSDLSEGIQGSDQIERPADKLMPNYTIRHKQYGIGVVRAIIPSANRQEGTAIIDFENSGEKKFIVPTALKSFMILNDNTKLSKEEIRRKIQCNITTYVEWLADLSLINSYKEYLGNCLYETLFELLVGKIGLKAKFVEDRFKEKGWR